MCSAPVDSLLNTIRHEEFNDADTPALRNSLGAILLGSLICAYLSGIVGAQAFLYYRIYPKDSFKLKFMVTLVWFLDILHTAFVCASVWTYLIQNFGDMKIADFITWTVAVTVAFTALITFLVQSFFAHRIYTLSRGNWFISIPIHVCAFIRLVAALVSTGEMIRLRKFSEFVQQFAWVFTVGLVLGAFLDIVIAAGLCYYLRRSRTGFSRMDYIIDSITLYTVENGSLTCVTTIVSLVCWLTMSHNLIFLGLHFAISKLYANSFLATLNARKALMTRSQGSSDRGEHALPVLFPDTFRTRADRSLFNSQHVADPTGTKLHINVVKTVDVGGEPSNAYAPSDLAPDESDDVAKIDRA